MKQHIIRNHRRYGSVGAVMALLLAGVYLVLVPDAVERADGIVKMILLYGHSLCWLLLGGASVWWAVVGSNKWSALLAYSALGVYGCFLVTLLLLGGE